MDSFVQYVGIQQSKVFWLNRDDNSNPMLNIVACDIIKTLLVEH